MQSQTRWPLSQGGGGGGEGKAYAEFVGSPASPVEELRDDGSRAIRTIVTAWDTRWNCMRDFLGYAEIGLNGATQYIRRKTPAYHPDYTHPLTGKPTMFCTEVQRIEPWGIPPRSALSGVRHMRSVRDVATYQWAKCTLVYTSLPYEILNDNDPDIHEGGIPNEAKLKRYVTIMGQPAAQALLLPLNSLKYVDGSATPVTGQQVTALVPEHTWNITWHRVPTAAVGTKLVNTSAASYPLDECLGCVNKTAFPPGATNQWGIGTVALVGATLRPFRSPFGDRLWDVTYHFKVFNPKQGSDVVGHNWLIKPVTNTSIKYYEITVDGSTRIGTANTRETVYDYKEFANLFKVPA